MQQHTFKNIAMAPQVHAPHPSGFVEMRKRSFQSFAPLPQQAFPARATNPSAVAVDGVTGLGIVLPVAPPAIRLRDVAAHADRFEIHHYLIAVIALVRNHLWYPFAVRDHSLDLLRGFDQRLDARRRVPFIRVLHRHGHDRTRFQIDGLLGLVSQVRPVIFHLRDLRVGIVRMRPVVVRAFLRPLAIEARQVVARRRFDARRLRQLGQELLIRLARVAPHNAAQRRVRFQGGRVDPDRLPQHEPGICRFWRMIEFTAGTTAASRPCRLSQRPAGECTSGQDDPADDGRGTLP